MFSTGSTQKDQSQHKWKIVDWGIKNQIKQTNKSPMFWDHVKMNGNFIPWNCYILLNYVENRVPTSSGKPGKSTKKGSMHGKIMEFEKKKN